MQFNLGTGAFVKCTINYNNIPRQPSCASHQLGVGRSSSTQQRRDANCISFHNGITTASLSVN